MGFAQSEREVVKRSGNYRKKGLHTWW